MRHVDVVGRRFVFGRGAFGENQTDAAFGARAIVCGNLVIRDLVGRFRARHGRHDDAVGQNKRLEPERLEEYLGIGHGRFLQRRYRLPRREHEGPGADKQPSTTVSVEPENLVGTPPDEPPAEQELAELVHPRRSGLIGVFRHRNYRLFFTGQLISLMGSWMQNTAQPWLVYSLTHSTVLLGVTSFCS